MSKLLKANRSSDERILWKGCCLFLFAWLFISTGLLAQPKDNSPYSRIGLGESLKHTLSATGFGGLTAAYADPLHINLHNPASYAWLNATAFEAGMSAEYSSLSYNNQTAKIWTGNLTHLALAFPLHNSLNDVLSRKNRKVFWGMNLALLPNTMIGYDIETEEASTEAASITNIFKGTGGTSRLVWGTGLRYKNFSAGVNLGYLFGQLESERRAVFSNYFDENNNGTQDPGESLVYYQDKFLDNISIRGFLWNVGAQYRFDFDKKQEEDKFYNGRSLIIGVYGNSTSRFNTTSNVLRIGENTNYSPIQSDTMLNLSDVEQKGKLPAEWTIGVMYQKTAKLRIGAEYNFAGWSKYENEAKPETLYDSHRIAAGIEYIPNASSYNNYLKRVRYRAGFYHRTDPRLDDLSQYALTLGLGLPVILPRQQTSFVNFAVEIGQFNTTNAIKETFVKMSLGFTLNESTWFFKRKFG